MDFKEEFCDFAIIEFKIVLYIYVQSPTHASLILGTRVVIYIGWPMTGHFPDDFCKGPETLSPEGTWRCPAALKCSSPQTQACFSPYLNSSGTLPAAKGVLQAVSALSSSVKLTPMFRYLTSQLAWCLFTFLQHQRHLMVHLHC